MAKKDFVLAFGIIALASVFLLAQRNNVELDSHSDLRSETNFEVTYKQISSLLRSPISCTLAKNDIVFGGDESGGINIWSFDQKKKKLQFQDTSRSISPVLGQKNKVIAIDSLPQGVVTLTQDGKLTTYSLNSASKITGKISFNTTDLFSDFRIVRIDESTYIATVSASKKDVCLYQASESIIRPNPFKKIACNTTAKTLTGLSYDNVNNLIAVGDQSQAILYQINSTNTDRPFEYLCEANMPKADSEGFDSEFRNGTLLAVNDIWVASIIIDLNGPSAKVLSSARTESSLTKKGQTTKVSVNVNEKSKETIVMVNAKNFLKGYLLEKNNKLQYKNQCNNLGRTEDFSMMTETTLLSGKGIYMSAYEVGGNSTSNQDYISYLDDKPIDSYNHYQRVNAMAYWNNTVVSVSEGGPSNFKLWKTSDFALSEIDEKSISYFSLLKSGNMIFKSIALLPPPSKQNANATLHIATCGADPFEVVMVNMNAQGKIGSVDKSKDSHSSNISAIFVTPDYKEIITASMDTLIKVWSVNNNHSTVDNVTNTIITKYGPISNGLQDKTGQYYIFSHSQTNASNLVNITVWQTDSKKGLIKVAENTPSEAHESNLTDLIFSKDQKYIISLSQSGQLRLWQHKDFSMVDLLASLSIGIVDVSMTVTDSNKLILQSKKQFTVYSFDFNGFILEGRKTKQYEAYPSSMLVVQGKLYSGDADGAIRTYQYTD